MSEAVKTAIEAAQAALKDGDLEKARALLEPFSVGENLDPAATILCARTWVEDGDFNTAADLLTAAREVKPKSFALAFRLGRILGQQGRTSQAVECLRDAQSLDGNKTRALELASQIALEGGEGNLASELAEMAFELDPTSLEALLLRFEAEIARGHYVAARGLGDRLLDAPPDNPNQSLRLIRALCSINEMDDAMARLDALDSEVHRKLGRQAVIRSLLIAGRLDDACERLERPDPVGGELADGNLWIRLHRYAGNKAEEVAWQDRLSQHTLKGLPIAPLASTVLRQPAARPPGFGLARALRVAHALTGSSYSLDRFRVMALKGRDRSNLVAQWWRAGMPRASEIDALLEPVDPGPLASTEAATRGAIVVNCHAGPTLAAVWWLQNYFESFHVVGDPFGSPYRTGDWPLELDVRRTNTSASVRLLLGRLEAGAVLGFAPQIPGEASRTDRVDATLFGQSYAISSIPARMAHRCRKPIFWVQPRWTGAGKVKVEIAQMVSPRPGETRGDYATRWAKEFLERTERFLRTSPENASPQTPLWQVLSLPEGYSE